MLERIRQMLGGKEIPEEIQPLYAGARDEREALILLKEARRRDESRRRRSIQDLEILDRMEEQLLNEGKVETQESRKLLLARRIKEIRWKQQEINHRVENIYNKRIRIFNEHVQSLETVLELSSEAVPNRKTLEEMAIRAKQMLEELDKTKELAEGIAMTAEAPTADAEEREILKEFEAHVDREIEKEELSPEDLTNTSMRPREREAPPRDEDEPRKELE